MSDWIPYANWQECVRLEKPGLIFEVVNGEGQSLFTTCSVPLQLPFDWKSQPVRFRLVAAPPVRRSSPLPKHSKQC
jgi:hypothetical protein